MGSWQASRLEASFRQLQRDELLGGLFDLLLQIGNVAYLRVLFEPPGRYDCSLPRAFCFLLPAECGGCVSECRLSEEVCGLNGYRLASERKGLFGTVMVEEVATPLGSAGGCRLGHIERSAIDIDPLVDGLVGPPGLEALIGIESATGPLATAKISGADQYGPVDGWRHDIRATKTGGVDGGQCMAVNAVGRRIDLRAREVGEPAVFG